MIPRAGPRAPCAVRTVRYWPGKPGHRDGPHNPHGAGQDGRGCGIIPPAMSKAVFPEKPIVRPLAGTDYVLAEDYYFPATVGGWDVTVHVMPGFRTDGASIPRLLWPIFGSPYDPDIIAEAIGHDALYRGRIVPRRDADDAFRDMMKRRGRIRAWKRRRIWLGVRLFGWITWLRHTPEGVAEARRHISLAFAGGGKKQQAYNSKKGQP